MKEYIQEQKNNKMKICTYLIGCFLLLIPADTFEIFPGISILRILALLMIFSCFLYAHDSKIKLNWIIILLLGYIFFSVFQIFYTDYISNTISKVVTITMYAVLLISINLTNFNDKEKEFLNKCFFYSTWTAVIFIILFKSEFEGRLTISILGNKVEDPNQFCGYFIPGIVYYFYLFLNNKNKKLKNILILLLFLYLVFLTGSRGGLLAILGGMFAVFILYLKQNKNNKFWNKLIKVILIGILMYLIVMFILNKINPELAVRFSIENVISSGGTGRTEIWKYYINLYVQSNLWYKLFGYGLGSLSSIYRVAHNTWIESLLESGIIGSILLISIMLRTLKIVSKNNNIQLMSAFFALIILTLSLSLLSYKLLWGYLIIAIIFKNEKKKEVLKNE